MSFGKWRPSCLGLNVLIPWDLSSHAGVSWAIIIVRDILHFSSHFQNQWWLNTKSTICSNSMWGFDKRFRSRNCIRAYRLLNVNIVFRPQFVKGKCVLCWANLVNSKCWGEQHRPSLSHTSRIYPIKCEVPLLCQVFSVIQVYKSGVYRAYWNAVNTNSIGDLIRMSFFFIILVQ